MSNAPLMSVVLPVHNGALYLAEALRSILAQSAHDLELIIVDDGSIDDTPQIVAEMTKADNRVRCISSEKVGFADALNIGIGNSAGKYIARMDADDVSMPQRLARQAMFLSKNPHIDICGSWVQTFGCTHAGILKFPVGSEEIACALLFYSALCHPSVIFRREVFSTGLRYDRAYAEAADYKLWSDCIGNFKMANLPVTLLRYRQHAAQVTQSDAPRQQTFARKVRENQLCSWMSTVSSDEIEIHDRMGNWRFSGDLEYVDRAERWLLRLIQANRDRPKYSEPTFARMISGYWYRVCAENAVSVGKTISSIYCRSPLADAATTHQRIFQTAKLHIKSRRNRGIMRIGE